MMQDISLRALGLADFKAILDLYGRCVTQGDGMFEDRGDADVVARHCKEALEESAPYLVAVCEGEIVGCAYAERYQPGAGFAHCVQSGILVDPGFRGQGLGWALLRDLMIACRGAGYRQVVTYLRADAEPALALHASLGFTVIGWHRDACQAFGASHDVVALRRVLDRIGPASEIGHALQPPPRALTPAGRGSVAGLRGLAARLSVPAEFG